MKKIFSFLLCIAGIFALSNCSKDEEVTTGTITGLVSDVTNSNTAIAGATVTLSPFGLAKTTGSDGRYEFTEVAPGSYAISVSANNYQTDTKSVTVYAGQVATADFQLGATSTPVTISPMTLSFGPNNEQLSFTLTNLSNRTLQYSISGYPAYLTVTPSSAQVAARGTQTITVKVNRGAITSDVSTQLTVNVGSDSYPVCININSQDLTTKMTVSPTSLDFGTSYTTLQFSVRNVGTGGDLTWNISAPTDASLSVSPTNGVTAMGNATPVTVTLDRSKLSGDITAFINVNTNGGSVPVTVTASKTGNNNGNGGGSTGSASSVVTAGLQAYYTFDDETAKDITIYGLDGLLINSPSFVTDTPNGSGKAIFLNSNKDQRINIPYNPFKGISSYSVSMWVKDFSAGVFLGVINGTRWDWLAFKNTEEGRFVLNTGNDNQFTYNSAELLDNQWHLLTFTHKAGSMKLYVDGILVSSEITRYESLTEGARIEVQNNMLLDNLRLYNRELSADDVKAIYNAER